MHNVYNKCLDMDYDESANRILSPDNMHPTFGEESKEKKSDPMVGRVDHELIKR